jgi:phosphatidyl-myo-inositol dimannoside synthase
VRTVWLTNDLPPRAGGIEQFLRHLLRRTDPEEALVLGPAADGRASEHDRREPYEVRRLPWSTVLPTPAVRSAAVDTVREHDADVIVLGTVWPLGELAAPLTRATGTPVVGLTHGHEAGLVSVGLGYLIRRATRGLAAVTTISDFTEQRLRPHLRAQRMARVPPGVEIDSFHPSRDGGHLRDRWGVPRAAPVVGCISRLVKRKGQDVLIEAWPEVRAAHPDAWLVIVGDGPREAYLRRRVDDIGPDGQVVLAGPVAWTDLPDAFATLDVFAMPCRTRMFGMDVEGLGIVYLEAQSSGVPVIAGRSGGAPETVCAGETGSVVDGNDPAEVAAVLAHLLADPDARREMGASGRRWVEEVWSWTAVSRRFRLLLEDAAS